jgi:hypothetical protein
MGDRMVIRPRRVSRCLQNPGLAQTQWVRPESCSGAPSGRIHVRCIPRAKALGYAVMPLRGNRPFRPFAASPFLYAQQR